MLIFENVKLAVSAIKANKMRSFLTMLGMIIGIFSVITIVSLGDTMRGAMASEYENIGLGVGFIYIITDDGYYTSDDMFTKDDAERVKEAIGDLLDYVGMSQAERCDFKVGRKTEKAYLTGLAENPLAYKPLKISYGRMFSNKDIREERRYAVVEESFARSFFGTEENAVGKTVKTTVEQSETELTIIGVYKNQDSALMKLLSGGDISTIYCPETLFINDNSYVWGMDFVVHDASRYYEVQEKLAAYTARIKGVNRDNIKFQSAQSDMGSVDRLLGGMSAVVTAIAAISLLVGGIGIMNIMLVSVTERTREIGIRKALGARTKDITTQFLVEAAIISAAGGTIGMLLGIGVATAAGIAFGISAVVKPAVVIIAVAFSATVGLGFGMYPAKKAAKKDPVEALRYE